MLNPLCAFSYLR